MTKKIISAAMVLVMLCLCLAGCGCESKPQANADTDEVAKQKVEELMENFKNALNNNDADAYKNLTTETMRSSDNDINNYYDQIEEFILWEIAFNSKKQNGTTYEIPIHYYITFSKDYKGSQYKTGISNMTDIFIIVKDGDSYKLDNIRRLGH